MKKNSESVVAKIWKIQKVKKDGHGSVNLTVKDEQSKPSTFKIAESETWALVMFFHKTDPYINKWGDLIGQTIERKSENAHSDFEKCF